MTAEEVCKELNISMSALKGHFKRTVESVEKKTSRRIVKSGRGAATSYEILESNETRALVFYEEENAERELFINQEVMQLENLAFNAFLGVLVKPMGIYRGTFKDFLIYIGIRKPTENNINALKVALQLLLEQGLIFGGIDKTDTNWFHAGLYRAVEKQIGLDKEQIKKCREIAEAEHKQSWIPIVKTWAAIGMLSEVENGKDYFVNQDISDVTGLSLYSIRESTKLLKKYNIYKEEWAYSNGQLVDENGSVVKTDGYYRIRKGKRAIMNGFYTPISDKEQKAIAAHTEQSFV